MKFGVCSKGGDTPLLLISLGRFHMVLEHRTNLWTNGRDRGKPEEERGVLAKEEDRTEG